MGIYMYTLNNTSNATLFIWPYLILINKLFS